MMPLYSWLVPGMKPGTSTKVTTGILKASQKATNRAAFWLAGIGYFWLYLDKNNDALHDKMSETKVILMPKGHKPFEKKTT